MERPGDHAERLVRAKLSLEGLALGDGLGEMLLSDSAGARKRADEGLVGGPWFHTDDTEMALSLYETLQEHATVVQDDLARRFAGRFQRDPDRGYGKMTRINLRLILSGEPWEAAARASFGGTGSMGNGGAMRVAPLGAYFAEESDEKICSEARLSAEVTHTHPEGVAGTIAIAMAAATAWRLRDLPPGEAAPALLQQVYECTPEGETRVGIARAQRLPFVTSAISAARVLGNGSMVTAPDTVPFALWSAAKHLHDYREAILETLAGDGDCDTNCAIVGGIVALSAGRESIPEDWSKARERFDFERSA